MQMDEDMIADLKQFITGVMAQQLANLRDELKQDILRVERKLERVEGKLEKKIDDLSVAVAEAIDSSNEATTAQLKNHERRIVRLERKAA